MDRTFHRRVGVEDFAVVAAAAALSLMLFMSGNAAAAMSGFGMLALAAVAVERIIHTTYTLTADGMLVVNRGRFSRSLAISEGSITAVRLVKRRFFLSSHVLVEHGNGMMAALRPENGERFVAELRKGVRTRTGRAIQ